MSEKHSINEANRNRPFSQRLASGESEITPVFFDMEVLERYLREPRYDIFYNGIIGEISLQVEADLSTLRESDKVWIKTFGTAYDSDGNRAIIVYLIYLSQLTSEHQMHWSSRMVQGEYKVHPGFYEISVKGQFAEKLSIFEAILGEMKAINELSNAVYRRRFFRKVPEIEFLSRKLTLLIRSTRQEYHEFVLSLDKLISENIERSFFTGDILRQKDPEQKGTISLLGEWLGRKFACDPPELIPSIIKTFRKIRNERQYPAHDIQDDEHGTIYIELHKELVFKTYQALAHLRSAFSSLPGAEEVIIDDFLKEGKIYGFI